MITIHKFPLQKQGINEFVFPSRHEVLCAKEQNGVICIWVRIDDEDKTHVAVRIHTCYTGREAPDPADAKYIDTVLLHHGSTVVHVFKER